MKRKIIVKFLIALLISFAIVAVSQSLMPILGNDVAIGQLKNDDFYFVAMNTWHQTNYYLGLAAAAVWAIFGASISIDIYKYMKNKKADDPIKKFFAVARYSTK